MKNNFVIPEPVVLSVKGLMKNKNFHFFVFKERKKNGPLMVTDAGSVEESKRMLQLVLMMYFDSIRDSGASFDDFSTSIKELLDMVKEDSTKGPLEDSSYIRLSRKKGK